MSCARPESLKANYYDIFFSYYLEDEMSCSPMIKEHYLVYVYSGEILVKEKDKETVINKGECFFLRRDNRVDLTKQPKNGEPFKAIFMMFKRNFLREFYQTIRKDTILSDIDDYSLNVVKMPDRPDITSLFHSLTPYFDSSIKPSEDIIRLKLQEGVYTLLTIDPHFYSCLFDFTEPWKIDILDYLNENYKYDLSLEQIAHFTGRSLSTFKRDFKKISPASPQKWLMEKRLKVALDKIRNEKKKVSDVYLEVGFKNLSHFSSAFKKQFGYSPVNSF